MTLMSFIARRMLILFLFMLALISVVAAFFSFVLSQVHVPQNPVFPVHSVNPAMPIFFGIIAISCFVGCAYFTTRGH